MIFDDDGNAIETIEELRLRDLSSDLFIRREWKESTTNVWEKTGALIPETRRNSRELLFFPPDFKTMLDNKLKNIRGYVKNRKSRF